MRTLTLILGVAGIPGWAERLWLNIEIVLDLQRRGFGFAPELAGFVGYNRFAIPALGMTFSLIACVLAYRAVHERFALALALASSIGCATVWLYSDLARWT